MRRSYILLVLLALTVAPAGAQRLIVYGVRAEAFPMITAGVIALDASGRPIPLSADDSTTVSERGVQRTTLGISGGEIGAPRSLSVSVVLNVRHHPDRAQAFMRRLIAMLPTPESEMSIAAGDREMIVLRNMTRSREALLHTVDLLPPMRYAWLPQLLNDSIAGGYAMLAAGTNRKVTVVLTETDPLIWPHGDVRVATDSISTYVVYIGDNRSHTENGPTGMRQETTYPNWATWTRVDASDPDAVADVASCIVAEQSIGVRTLRWYNDVADVGDIPTVITIASHGLRTETTYRTGKPSAVLRYAPIQPFPSVPPGAVSTEAVTLTADGGSIDIFSVRTSDPRFTLIADSLPPMPFHLVAGASLKLTVAYVPTDSLWTIGTLDVDVGSSTYGFALSGGFHGRPVRRAPLTLTSPKGGEIHAVGATVAIAWSGVSSNTAVRLEYSSDGGESWSLIHPGATGGQLRWRAPVQAMQRCLVRGIATESPWSGADVLPLYGTILSSGYSNDGTMIAAATSRPARVRVIDPRTGDVMREIVPGVYDLGARRSDHLCWSPRDHRLLIPFRSDVDGSGVEIWDADSAVMVRRILLPDSLFLDSAAWCGDARRVALFCRAMLTSAPALMLYDAASGARLARVPVEARPVVFSRDGTYALAVEPGTIPQTLMLIDGFSGIVLRRFVADTDAAGRRNRFTEYAIRPDNAQILARGDFAQPLRLIDLESGRSLPQSLDSRWALPIWNADGTKLFVRTDTGAVVLDAITFRFLYAPPRDFSYNVVRWSPDGRFLAMLGRNTDGIAVSDAVTGRVLSTLVSGGWFDIEAGLAWSPDGGAIVYGDYTTGFQEWFIAPLAPAGADTSDGPFSLIEPSLSFGPDTVHMGTARDRVGYADSVVHRAVCNNSPIAIDLHADILSGGSRFMLIDGDGDFTLQPGTCRDLTLAFLPSGGWTHSTQAYFVTTATNEHHFFSVDAVSVGRPGPATYDPVRVDQMDCGALTLGLSRNTTMLVNLGNTSATDLTVHRIIDAGPDSAAFEILEPRPPFTLRAGDSVRVAVRFHPTDAGRLVTRFLFDVMDGAEPFRLRVGGIGVEGARTPGEGSGASITIIPNIVHASAVAHYALAADGPATLELYDLLGHRLATLADDPATAGAHALPIHTEDLASGVYIIRLRTADGVADARVQIFR